MKKLRTLVLIISLMILINVQMYAQNVVISANTFTTNPSAMLEIKSTSNGLLIPRMTTAQRNSISNPPCTDSYDDVVITTASFTCGDQLVINHTAGDVAPETKSVNYGTVLTNIGGTGDKCWITQNLGADNQAGSATDETDAAAGWYWQFNRKQGYKVGPTPAWTITSIDENSDWLPANDPCTIELGAGWRIPTYTEWYYADKTGSWNNYNDTYNSVLKIHAAGYLHNSDGSLNGRGTNGYYWSSTQNSSTTSWHLNFTSIHGTMLNYRKASGFSLRCLRD